MTNTSAQTNARAPVTIRHFKAGDLAALIGMNNLAVPAVNGLSAEELNDQINEARLCLVAVEPDAEEKDAAPLGFLLCYANGANYDSRNYRWISERLTDFFYTDRICVAADQRGRRIGEALYQALFERLSANGTPFTCEVNTRPANPGSLKFHKRLGFEEFGTSEHEDKAVVYLKRSPSAK